ncbi:MAG: MgtC/SapB family protein [Candidatus Gracilibacteria bacterium]|jgi:uncharacterized membrane protein (DUF4010 family)
MNQDLLFLQNLGLALLMGSLIGLERERNRDKKKPSEFGGIRTMALISVLGYLIYSLFYEQIVIFGIMTAGYVVLLIASYIVSSYQNRNSGATTEIAGLFSYLIGTLVGMGKPLHAAVVTLLVVMILYFKEPLHKFAHKMGQVELYDTIKFIAIVFVVLPLLPNRTFGPLDVLNPYQIWLVVVLISSISFASYIAIKLAGPKRGTPFSGFLGGLISSTAVAMSFSALSKKNPKIVWPFVIGILLAASAMFARILLAVSVLNQNLFGALYPPLSAMAFTGFLICAVFYTHKQGESAGDITEKDMHLKSPFQLGSAIKFGLLFGAMLFISKFASLYFGNNGIYLTAFLSGIADVDAITVSMANLSREGSITASTGALAIVIAAMTNTASKSLIVIFFASNEVRKKIVFTMFFIIAAGILALSFSV